MALAINELLKLNPLAPESADEKARDFQGANKPPDDDAPIRELVAYWTGVTNYDAAAPKLTDKVRRRLLEACEDRPDLLYSLVDYLPENPDTHDRLYKLLKEEPEGEETWKPRVRNWLACNSAYFRDDLIQSALGADNYIDSAVAALRNLARLDWDATRPILETLASAGKKAVSPTALALLYEHAVKEGDSARAESHRALLKATVENRQADWFGRASCLVSLMGSEWSGQEEWFISLFADPTLSGVLEDEEAESKGGTSAKANAANGKAEEHIAAEFYPGFLHAVLLSNTDRWLPVVGNLIGHNHRLIHRAAVRCLVNVLTGRSVDDKTKKEIAQKLIPWLTEPDWAVEAGRDDFIRGLIPLNLPELAPGLIWILDHDETPYIRALAAEALTKYRDPRAIPALRRALEKEESEAFREKIVAALAECGGFPDGEMAAAVEAFVRKRASNEGAEEIEAAAYGSALNTISLPLNVSVGRILNDSKNIQATEGMALILLERARTLRATEPAVAREILRVIEAAPLRIVEIDLVERVGEGWVDIDSITLALKTRDALIKSAGGRVYDLIKEGGYAAGVAAAILNEEREWKGILENGDAKAQLALLASARYLRDKLPVELVARLLKSPNRVLAKAAESYLEMEDSAEARKLVLARRPGEAYILGDLTAINFIYDYLEAARRKEDALRKEVRSGNGPDAIYAVLQTDMLENYVGVVIRVRGDKAEMSVYETEGRRKVRWLTAAEFEELKSFTSRPEVEELGPESYPAGTSAREPKYEYLRLTKESGRRIVIDDLQRSPKNPTLHEELSGLFYRLSRTGEFTTRYDIEDKIPGVEVVFADPNRSALKVCAEGGEMRVLVEEKGEEYKLGGAKNAPEWREFSSDKPGEVRDEPSACRKWPPPPSTPKNVTAIRPAVFGQPPRPDEAPFYITYGEDSGIWKVGDGLEPVKIVSGDYYEPIITPDGKWLVAFKRVKEKGKTDWRLIRRNLQSGEEFVFPMPRNIYDIYDLSLTYAAAHGKVLACAPDQAGGYLLDHETGTVQPVNGEFRPLIASDSAALQSAGAPHLFWAVIDDMEKSAGELGKYDSKNFVFTPLLKLPELRLEVGDIWVDAAGARLWFVYRGHLLRLPIPSQTK